MFNRIDKGLYWDKGITLVHGCTKVSEGCKNCWSLGIADRFKKGNEIKFHLERLIEKSKTKIPTVFAIWNDLFHQDIDFEDIDKAYLIFEKAKHHIFMILTKRPHIMLEYYESRSIRKPLQNVWIGTTIEHKDYRFRLKYLLDIPAVIKYISYEPALSELFLHDCLYDSDFNFKYIDWVIAGPETGSGKRPYLEDWFYNIYSDCQKLGIPFFDKKNVMNRNIRELPLYHR